MVCVIRTALVPEPTVRATVRVSVAWWAVRRTMPLPQLLEAAAAALEIAVADPPVTVSAMLPAMPLPQPSAAS